MQAGTQATIGIPVPAGLDAAESEALESGLRDAAPAMAEAVAVELGLTASGVNPSGSGVSSEVQGSPAPSGDSSGGGFGGTALYASVGAGASVVVAVVGVVVWRRRVRQRTERSEPYTAPTDDQAGPSTSDEAAPRPPTPSTVGYSIIYRFVCLLAAFSSVVLGIRLTLFAYLYTVWCGIYGMSCTPVVRSVVDDVVQCLLEFEKRP